MSTPVGQAFLAGKVDRSTHEVFRETASELGLGKTNPWICPHHDHDRNVERYAVNVDAPLPLAYISFPSAKDPDFRRRHPGRATVEVVTLAPYAWFRKWENEPWKKRGDEYEELKGKCGVWRLGESKLARSGLTRVTASDACSYSRPWEVELGGNDPPARQFEQRSCFLLLSCRGREGALLFAPKSKGSIS